MGGFGVDIIFSENIFKLILLFFIDNDLHKGINEILIIIIIIIEEGI